MKRWLIVLLLCSMAQPLYAGWKQIGIQGWAGIAYDSDDLFFNTPLLGCRAELVAEYAFHRRAYIPQHVSLRLGVGATRRGTEYEMDFAYAEASRWGRYSLTSLTVPVHLAYNHPVMLKEERMAMLSFWMGPTLSMGLGGRMHDVLESQRYDAAVVNYDSHYEGSAFFEHVGRLDVAMEMGVSYHWDRCTLNLLWSMGLVAMRKRADAMPFVDVMPEAPHEGRYGVSRMLLMGMGYHFPIRGKIHHSHQRGNVFM